jgi:CHAD domain-containing protein
MISPEQIETLREYISPTLMDDTMAEAGRKILLRDFVAMLGYMDGARTGDDIEDLHQMRVATRRMRSTFRLLDAYYKNKPVRPFVAQLKQLAATLGRVRDLDVMIAGFEGDKNNAKLVEHLEAKRVKARKRLVSYLDSPTFEKFINSFQKFLTVSGKAAKDIKDETSPHQVRHVLPILIHDHLANVRAFDTVIDQADVPTLHALRIEFKRLRYTLQNFEDVLGASSEQFVLHIKEVQDYLGRLNDVFVAHNRLESLLDEMPEDDEDYSNLSEQMNALLEEEAELTLGFIDVWNGFNKRMVQRKLADALLVLR